jgi:hypothetical protein
MWAVIEMLLIKNWLETRWRLTAIFGYLILFLAINYHNQAPGMKVSNLLIPLWMILTFGVLTLAGGGVKTQSPAGFPEGLAESTQFTIALPVSRLRLVAVRAAVGLMETSAVTVIAACAAWNLFPVVRVSTTPADFARVLLTTLVWLTGPYCVALLFETLLAEPFSMVIAGLAFSLLLWLLHHIAPAVDVVRAFGQESPLITHRLPWPQMATSASVALILFVAAVRIVQTREY